MKKAFWICFGAASIASAVVIVRAYIWAVRNFDNQEEFK